MNRSLLNLLIIFSEQFITYLMTNRNSLVDKFNTNINKCDICFSEYNRREKQPVIICTMHHTICRQCMSGLETTRKCPFCRENINFSKVVINNYIFELLPNDPLPPNSRVEINRPIQQPMQLPAQPRQQYIEANPPPRSINYQPAQQIYPPNYYPPPPPPDYYEYHPVPFNQQQLLMYERPFDTSDCVGSIRNKLGLEVSPDREGMYIVIFFFQLPYLIFDFYFALTGSDPKCYDTPYNTRAYVLRPWLLAMGITQASIMGFIFFAALLKICGAISFSCLKCCQFIALGMLVVKILLWIYMELALFAAVIAPHCSGGIFAYGVFQTVIHGILLLIIFCLSACK